ncbi:hypothetical protein QYF61_008788 [Mycteria americana]|uniref:Integrase catalytic domain-containing protein n=1 Tax=Mycteria americana TaxID=33587 RepID=A0AAN7NGB8_MYCAM|nr:hypothetical protein QYF61_008788 [Mycteria americana]
MDTIAQVIHECETCTAIKQAKRLKLLWYGGQVLCAYNGGSSHQMAGNIFCAHATAQNTILGLEKQVLWQHGTPERIVSDNGTHFRNDLIDTWAKEHGIEWRWAALGIAPPQVLRQDRVGQPLLNRLNRGKTAQGREKTKQKTKTKQKKGTERKDYRSHALAPSRKEGAPDEDPALTQRGRGQE